MKKIFSLDEYSFNLYDEIISILYNSEKTKNTIIEKLSKSNFIIINSRGLDIDVKVNEFLKASKFDMKLLDYFNLHEYLNTYLSDLQVEDQLYIKLVSMIFKAEQTIIFDDVLSYLSEERKKTLIRYIFDKNIKYINFTSDVEEVIFSNYLIVLSKDGVAIEGKVKSVLSEEKILKRLGFSLPVVFDISLQLKAYGLIDKPYIDMKKLVNDLWK